MAQPTPPTQQGEETHAERPIPAERGVYGISVVAELMGVGIHTLRLYEQKGLLEPSRTAGGTRRYSDNDLSRLRRIGELVDEGVNLAGIAMILRLEDEVARLRATLGDGDGSRRADSAAGSVREWAEDVADRARTRGGRSGRSRKRPAG